jgi:hypothetical protein
MIAAATRKSTSLNWRLRLQTSGIYRDSAIPGCKVKVKTGGDGRLTPPPRSGLAPEVSAQVASLQSLILCSGQIQRRLGKASSSRL